ncbi:MAG: IclR family transcriptional regulator, regulon repressor [Clostridiales bacterium]|jgi:DNA-binding IclR family transcriptional regulator|nr:IclR family transcriptional regulator, regulon repressor [Clostridiales bacterium]
MGNFGKVQSIERAAMILQCFSEKTPELKLTEIADYLDLNKSTIHGIINTMKDFGLIDQNEDNQKYRLGLKLVELGSLVLKNLDIREVANPVLKALCEEVNETIHLGVLDGYEIVYIDKMESTQSIRMFTTIGTRYLAYCSAIGKSILAYKALDDIERYLPPKLERFTEHSLTTVDAIIEELKRVKSRGYAFDMEEVVEGLRCIGAPIYNHEGKVVYSISISGPIGRMTDERMETLATKIKAAALEISKRIGYLG